MFLNHFSERDQPVHQLGAGQYWLADVGGIYQGYVDGYSVASIRRKLWLPEATQAPEGGSSTTTEQLFMLDVPTGSSTPAGGSGGVARAPNTIAVPTISLGDLKSRVATLEAEANAGGTPEYRECVESHYQWKRLRTFRIALRGSSVTRIAYSIASGLPAGTVMSELPGQLTQSSGHYGRMWYEGPDKDLMQFKVVDFVTSTRDVGYYNYTVQKVTARPLPAGSYTFFPNVMGGRSLPCNKDWSAGFNQVANDLTVTPAPDVLHEAFFDPADIGDAVGADDANGFLEPADFRFGGATTTITSLKWENGAVTMGLSPAASLSGRVMDIIDVTGTTTLSLSLASGSTTALAWSVPEQPWSDGDLLMLRIGPASTTSTVTDVLEPASARNLRATSTASAVRLQWDTPDRGPVTGYQVLRRQPSIHAVGVFEPIVEDTGSTSTSYVDTEAVPLDEIQGSPQETGSWHVPKILLSG